MTAALAVGFGLGYLIAGVVGMLLAGTVGLIAEVSQM